MTLWSPLVEAYEADLQVLEEARLAYLKASQSILEGLAAGIKNLGLADLPIVTFEEDSPEEETVIAGAPWLRARFKQAEELPGFEIDAWVASSWGGPNGVLRIGLALDDPPHPFSAAPERWVRVAQASLPENLGEPYSPERHSDACDGTWLRIHSIPIAARERQEILSDGLKASEKLVAAGMQALESIGKEAQPLLDAYAALKGYRPRLLAEAAALGVNVSGEKLGSWKGTDYLEIGKFWVCIDPVKLRVLAEAQPADAEAVQRIARAHGTEVSSRHGYPSLMLWDENEPGSRPPREVIAEAFDTWLAWKQGR